MQGEKAHSADRRIRWLVALAAAACFAVLTTSTATAASYIEGVDVSHYNGKPDWSQAKADGVKFVIAKATEGTTFVDSEYARNKQQAESLALPFTAYHFANPDTAAGDATAEADHFVDTAMLTGKNLLPVLDLEVSGGLGARKLKAWTKDWLAQVRARTGVKPIIYTSPSFWQDHMANSRWFADNGYRLWIAHWTSANQPIVPAANWGGRGWTLWQYTNTGAVNGIDGAVDRDRYAGSALGALKIKNNR